MVRGSTTVRPLYEVGTTGITSRTWMGGQIVVGAHGKKFRKWFKAEPETMTLSTSHGK
ncbi:hypothetical protein HAX54_004195, partial [Datura stramonium]|nr:hypothetical protein [Datura stramonium]